MIRTRKLKIIVIVLIVLSVSVLPMAFGVSYAKWNGGSNSINTSVNVVGGGSGSNLPDYVFKPDDFPEGFNGGMLIRGEDGNPVAPDVYVDSGGTTIGFTWDISANAGSGRIDNFDGELYVQFFMKTDNIDDPDAVTFTVDNPDKGVAGQPDTITIYLKAVNIDLHDFCATNNCGVSHESGSYWYKISRKGIYNVRLETSWADGLPRLMIDVY